MSHSASASVHLRAYWSSVRFRCKESRSPVKTLSSLSQSLHCSWAGFFFIFYFLRWCSKRQNLLLRENKVMHRVVMHPDMQVCSSGCRAPSECRNLMFLKFFWGKPIYYLLHVSVLMWYCDILFLILWSGGILWFRTAVWAVSFSQSSSTFWSQRFASSCGLELFLPTSTLRTSVQQTTRLTQCCPASPVMLV